ncbi:ABC transporter permease, partial [Halobium palmae]
MDPRETLRLAVRSVRAHRLRSTLTVLGVVIGIASVIAFASFGASVRTDVVSQFEGTSANAIYVTPGEGEGGPDDFGGLARPVFTAHDVERLRAVD